MSQHSPMHWKVLMQIPICRSTGLDPTIYFYQIIDSQIPAYHGPYCTHSSSCRCSNSDTNKASRQQSTPPPVTPANEDDGKF